MRVFRVSSVAIVATILLPGPLDLLAQASAPRSAPRRAISDPSDEKATTPEARAAAAATTGRPATAAPISDESLPGDEELQIIPPARRVLAPPLPTDLEWLRPAPISLEMLRGQIVMVDVWESNCINCLRSLGVISRLQ